MKNKKYELIEDDFILYKGKKLYRIRALRDIDKYLEINEGDIGGYIEGYRNLSQEGICWIYDDAKVYGNASVKDSATVMGNAEVYGNARVRDEARVERSAEVFGNAILKDLAIVGDHTKVYNNARLEGRVFVFKNAEICGNAVVYGNDKEGIAAVAVKGSAKILDNAAVISNRCAYYIDGGGYLCDNVKVHGNTKSVISLGRKFSNNSIIS